MGCKVFLQALKSNQGKANLPQFVRVPKSGLGRRISGSISSSSSPVGSGHRIKQSSTAGQTSSQTDCLALSPSSPVKKDVKPTPGSLITTDSLPEAVALGKTGGGKVKAGLCHFCHMTSRAALPVVPFLTAGLCYHVLAWCSPTGKMPMLSLQGDCPLLPVDVQHTQLCLCSTIQCTNTLSWNVLRSTVFFSEQVRTSSILTAAQR